MLGVGQCNQVRYSHHFSQKAEGKTIVWYKMLTKCIVLIIIIQKRLRIINIYYLFSGVRNDENIKFPWHSPSQMTINFNLSSSKGKVATVQYGPFFFSRQKHNKRKPLKMVKLHVKDNIDCKTISIGHQINLMIFLSEQVPIIKRRYKTEYFLNDWTELYNIAKEIKSVWRNVSNLKTN